MTGPAPTRRPGSISRRRWPYLALAAGVALPGSAWMLTGRAGASGAYQVSSSADGVRITVSATNAPVTNVPFDFGAPLAQSRVDSLQTSESFAALPYPGDLVVAGPGTVAGFSGGKLTPPSYPFVVQASYPVTPEGRLDQPGSQLHATAGPSEAVASASSGLRTDAAAAAATHAGSVARRASDGTIRAAATTDLTGFSVGPLTIGGVRSTADVAVPPSGESSKRSALDVTGVRVGDVAVEITPAGLRLAGSTTPLPPGSAVAETLSRSGLDVTYLAPQESDRLVVSPALAVTLTRSVEGPISPIRLTYVLGRAVAQIGTTSSASDAAGPGITPPPEPAAEGAGVTTQPAGETAPAEEAAASAVVSSISPALRTEDSRGTPSGSPSSAPSSAPPAAAGAADVGGMAAGSDAALPSLAQQRIRLAPPEFGTDGAYSLLIVAGLALLAATQLYRTMANRRAEVRGT